MKVYKVNIKDLVKALIEIYHEGADYVDIELIDEDRIKLTPIKIKRLDTPKVIPQDIDLEKLI